jgi:hypothetical protein
VTTPSKVYVPGDRTFARDSESHMADAGAEPELVRARIIVTSSLIE